MGALITCDHSQRIDYPPHKVNVISRLDAPRQSRLRALRVTSALAMVVQIWLF